MSHRWEPAFVAVAALLGEPLDAIEVGLGEGRQRAAELLRALRSNERVERARALATPLAEVAGALEAARLA
jgi:hypothetical protein